MFTFASKCKLSPDVERNSYALQSAFHWMSCLSWKPFLLRNSSSTNVNSSSTMNRQTAVLLTRFVILLSLSWSSSTTRYVCHIKNAVYLSRNNIVGFKIYLVTPHYSKSLHLRYFRLKKVNSSHSWVNLNFFCDDGHYIDAIKWSLASWCQQQPFFAKWLSNVSAPQDFGTMQTSRFQ